MRFAPSPTGLLHVGNARTALFNWLFARQQHGAFVLRIEDTDLERSEAKYETQLLADLKWLGLDWDEGPDVNGDYGPYRQSDRMEIYHRYAEKLVAEEKAYLCFCTSEELEEERRRDLEEAHQRVYSGKCRRLGRVEAQRRRAAGELAAIRLKIPEHPIRFHDVVRGEIEFPNQVISDPIIVRSSGMPVYNYVVVIDDATMKITHVIRGDDHLSNTPKQVALYEALGFPLPHFAHLSTILGEDRERLSKRHGATSISNFREMGVLPEALINYLGLLGWAPSGGQRETFTPEELIKEFQLERVTPSPAVFDMEKLYWLNRHYIKLSSRERLVGLAVPYFRERGLLPYDEELGAETLQWMHKVVGLFAPSVDRLDQLPERCSLVFHYDAGAAIAKAENRALLNSETGRKVVDTFSAKIEQLALRDGSITPERFKQIMNEIKNETGAKGQELFHPVRIMLTGSHSGPEFDKLVPILEDGSRLSLPTHVMSIHQRVQAFAAVRR